MARPAHSWQGTCRRLLSCHCCCLPTSQSHLCMLMSAALAFDTRRQESYCCCVLCRQLAGGAGGATPASVLKTGFGAAGSRVMPLLGAVANLVGDNPELQGALQ